MWEYSEKVKELFFNPRNAGAVSEANATGDVGSISCGDALRLTLKVDTETNTIQEAGFETFGCGSAIASSSALTEIIKGMTVDEALAVTNQDIADYLDGLPPEKMHCSVMGREALEAAVADYRGEEWAPHTEDEGALVCKCFGVDAARIESEVRSSGLTTVDEVTNYTKAGGGCSACHEAIEGILDRVNSADGGEPKTEPATAAVPTPAGLTNLQRIQRIQAVIEELRPQIRADGGDVELVEVEGDQVYVNMTGACASCMLASMTLDGIQKRLAEELGETVRVLPANQMTAPI